MNPLRRAGGLKRDTYMGDIHLTRMNADSTRQMLRTSAVDTTGAVTNDMALADGDPNEAIVGSGGYAI